MGCLIDEGQKSLYGLTGIGVNVDVGAYYLVKLGGIDIDMDNFCLLGILIDSTCHTVVKTHTDSQYHISLVSLDVGCDIAVHTHHTFVETMVGRE